MALGEIIYKVHLNEARAEDGLPPALTDATRQMIQKLHADAAPDALLLPVQPRRRKPLNLVPIVEPDDGEDGAVRPSPHASAFPLVADLDETMRNAPATYGMIVEVLDGAARSSATRSLRSGAR
jgi:hypothetical protein